MTMLDVHTKPPTTVAFSEDERLAVAEAIAYRIVDCRSMLRLRELASKPGAFETWERRLARLEAAQAKVGVLRIRYGEVTTT